MAYRLPGERVALDLDGPSVEVERILAPAIQTTGIGLYAAVDAAKTSQAQFVALSALYRFVAAESQPSWDILDHRGPVPATELGLLRLPVKLGLAIALGWLETYGDKATAVDELIPPGEAREELKRRLRAKRAA